MPRAKAKPVSEKVPITVVLEVVPDIAIRFPETPELRGHIATGATGAQALSHARSIVARTFPSHRFFVSERIRVAELPQDICFPKGTPVSKAVGMLLKLTGLGVS
jgi:hypothetical protein